MLIKPGRPPWPRAPQPSSGDPPLPPPPHDGGPATLTADTKDVRPVEPVALLETYHAAINARRHFAARLPLPLGLVAQLQTLREPVAITYNGSDPTDPKPATVWGIQDWIKREGTVQVSLLTTRVGHNIAPDAVLGLSWVVSR